MQISSHQNSNRSWTTQLDRWTESPPVQGERGDVYVSGLQHKLFNLDLETGDCNWQSDLGDMLLRGPQRATEETLILSSLGQGTPNKVIGVDAEDGKVKWSFDTNRWAQIDLSDKAVYTLVGQELTAIEVDNGEVLWSVPVENEARSEPVLSPDGSIYLCEDDPELHDLRHFFKLNSQTGAKEWSFFADESQVKFSPEGLLGVDHLKYDDDFNEVAKIFEVRSPENGIPIWKTDRIGWHYNSRFTDQGTVVTKMYKEYSDIYHSLESRDTQTGEINWNVQLPPIDNVDYTGEREILVRTSKVNPDRFGRYGHDLIALDPETGEKKWGFHPEVDRWQQTHYRGAGLYISGRRDIENTDRFRSVVFALDPETGAKKWEYQAGLSPRQFIEDEENGVLYITLGERKVVCLDADSGEALWHVQSDIDLEVSPQLTPDGRLLLTDINGKVAAVSADSSMARPGDTPSDPDKDYGMPVATRGFDGRYLMESSREIQGEQCQVVIPDYDRDETPEGWEPILVRDNNGDGEFTDEDLSTIPTRAFLETLDTNENGIVVGPELENHNLTWWRDLDGDGKIGEREARPRTDSKILFDLERLHETRRI